MKTYYMAPEARVIDIETDGILCQASGKYDADSIANEGEEDMGVRAQRSYAATSVEWDSWE